MPTKMLPTIQKICRQISDGAVAGYAFVHGVTKESVRRPRRNLGPTLIEHVTYRVGAYSTSDDPAAYRLKTESAAWSSG